MELATTLPPLAAIAGGVGMAARMAFWSRREPAERQESVQDWVNEAPAALKASVLVFCDPGQSWLLWRETGLGSADSGFPTVMDVDYTRYGLDVTVQMRGGHTRNDWVEPETLDAIAQYVGVPEVAATFPHPGFVRLQVKVFDTLAASATVPMVVPDDVDLEAVLTGVFEDGEDWCVPVQHRHVLIAGGMNAGKSNILWSLINGMGPAIRSGRVDLRVIDPKGGQELWALKPLCSQFACTTAEEMVGQIEGTVKDMEEATVGYRNIRKPQPTPDNPLVVTIIDEAATLSAFSHPKVQERFERAHGKLLSQGRAPLFAVIETVIDPSKENVPQRQLLPYRIGMRMDEPTQVAMIHGQGARERGSRCDEIPHSTPGVCYVQEDGKPGFRRARAFHVTDDDIDRIVADYTPAPRPVDLRAFERGDAA